MSANPFPPASSHNAVELVESFGEWFVRVVENGVEQVASFVAESFALAFAEGQRVRLGLDRVTRL
jgi:hypothetical protein